MNKPKRDELMQRLVKIAGLPSGKDTRGYLTRDQLVELVLFIENLKDSLKEKA